MKNNFQKLITVFEAMADGVCIVNQNFNIEYMNPVMIENLCDGTGTKCYKILEQQSEICSRCDAVRVFKGETLRREVYNKRADKFYDIVEIPLENDDGTISKLSIFRDISPRKRQEEKLKDSEQQFRMLFEHVGCGVFISSKEGKFLDANRALLDMLGYSNKEEFLKIDIAHDLYLRPEDRQNFIQTIEREGRVIDLEVEFKKRTVPLYRRF